MRLAACSILIDNFCNDQQQFVRWDIQPGIEYLDKLAAYFFAWIRGNESERLKDDLYIIHVVTCRSATNEQCAKNAPLYFEPTKFFLQIGFRRYYRTWTSRPRSSKRVRVRS